MPKHLPRHARCRVKAAPADASCTYDMFNRRLSKGGSGGVTTQYVYDGWSEVQEQNSKGAVSANMLNGPGLDDRFTRTVIASGTTSAFLVDGLGSTLGLAYTGAVKTDYAYQPYGTASVSGTSNTNTHEYTGRELDGSGLQYNRNRYYNPAWGRFVSEDPIGFAGGINVYGYVRGNPMNLDDPYGLLDWHSFLQGARNYGTRVGSYYTGLSAATKHIYWRSGLAGQCYQYEKVQDELILSLGVDFLKNPQLRGAAESALRPWPSNNKAYLAGGASAGFATTAASGAGIGGGASLTGLAFLGTALNNVDQGATSASGVLINFLGSEMPQPLHRSRCECSQ